MPSGQSGRAILRVVLFSGGRGSGALAELLATDPRVALTVAINGYDDGASTGAVRRFLGDSLGPSDFRKNASRLAGLRRTCAPPVLELLDRRLPEQASERDLTQLIGDLDVAAAGVQALNSGGLPGEVSVVIRSRLQRFERELHDTRRPIDWSNSSVGNFVFAGGFLEHGRNFNLAVDDYAAIVGLPAGLIENVTDGTNAFLVALDDDGRLLGSEEEIVDAKRRNRVKEIFLLHHPLDSTDRLGLDGLAPDALREALSAHVVQPGVNPRLVDKLAAAHLVIYAPGTQHSSLYPSYLTPGLNEAIAGNLEAIKLLVTNIQTDAEITGRSAVDLIERAVYYLTEKGRLTTPTPYLITHYLLNDPGQGGTERPYVPLGRLESLEDPRLIRVGNYEAGATGRHDASKVLAPFIEAFVARERLVPRVAIVLYETRSSSKIAQTTLEMVRGDIRNLRMDLTLFHASETALDPDLLKRLPFSMCRLESEDEAKRDRELRDALAAGRFDYVMLFESSGMYNGEDVASLASYLKLGRLDAIWGSRRLSVRDIEESYRLKYRHNTVLGAVSYIGSHLLSLSYLTLYGRYVSDTLSAVRAVRTSDALALEVPLTHKLANQYLLSRLLGRRAEMLEIPVQFFSLSPDRVRRTSALDGLRAIAVVVGQRITGRARRATPVPSLPDPGEARHHPQAWNEF